MYDTLDETRRVEEAGPSIPVNITGFNMAPSAAAASTCSMISRRPARLPRALSKTALIFGGTGSRHVTLENLFDRLDETAKRKRSISLSGNVRGSIEAIHKELTKLDIRR